MLYGLTDIASRKRKCGWPKFRVRVGARFEELCYTYGPHLTDFKLRTCVVVFGWMGNQKQDPQLNSRGEEIG